jgi:hypothetical protein
MRSTSDLAIALPRSGRRGSARSDAPYRWHRSSARTQLASAWPRERSPAHRPWRTSPPRRDPTTTADSGPTRDSADAGVTWVGRSPRQPHRALARSERERSGLLRAPATAAGIRVAPHCRRLLRRRPDADRRDHKPPGGVRRGSGLGSSSYSGQARLAVTAGRTARRPRCRRFATGTARMSCAAGWPASAVASSTCVGFGRVLRMEATVGPRSGSSTCLSCSWTL